LKNDIFSRKKQVHLHSKRRCNL